MAQSYTQVPPNSTGNKLATQTRTQGGDTVHDQVILIADGAGNIVGQTSNKLDVNVAAALPAGTNTIGKLGANSGVDIGDVDVARLSMGPVVTDSFTGSLQIKASTDVTGYSSVIVLISGTYSISVFGIAGATDNGTGTLIPSMRLDTSTIAISHAPSANATFLLQADVSSLTSITVQCGTYGSGTANVRVVPSVSPTSMSSTPLDPFGNNADAVVAAGAAGSIQAKLRRMTTDLDAIKTSVAAATPAGSNNIGDVDVLTLPALVAGTATIGNVGLVPQTTGGALISRVLSAASTNATSIKGSAGQIFGWFIYNANAATRYLKLYNKASAPTVGTDTPVITIPIPPGAAANVDFSNGIAFATGIASALTTGIADNDTGAVAANDIVVNIFYK